MISHVIWDVGDTLTTLPPEGMDIKPLDQYKEIRLRGDVEKVLEEINYLGYNQAILSNTAISDSKALQNMLENLGIAQFFSFVYATQSELDHQKPEKPDQEVFDIVFQALNIQPSEAVMIGNTWDTDIIGANHCGMHAIWLQNPSVSFRKIAPSMVQHPPWIIPVWDVACIPNALKWLKTVEKHR